MATFATDGLLDEVAQQQETLAELDICLQDEQLGLRAIKSAIDASGTRLAKLTATLASI
jgi:hypothetical protein